MKSKIIHGDCIDEMRKFPDESIDLIITDPPYQITACEWDKSFDLDAFWVEVKRVIKNNTNIIIFSSQPFTTDVINSNRKWFKYEIIWDKMYGTDIFNAKKKPLKSHENILVFNESSGFYNPQMEDSLPKNRRNRQINYKKAVEKSVYGKQQEYIPNNNEMKRYPKTVFYYSNQADECHRSKRVHPTQKPKELMKWLIKTYSQEEDMVLDCFAGSGSVMKACLETNRQYIMIEKELSYFELMKQSDKTSTSATPTLAKPKEFNMGDKVSATPTPKSPTATSHHPNIQRNLRGLLQA